MKITNKTKNKNTIILIVLIFLFAVISFGPCVYVKTTYMAPDETGLIWGPSYEYQSLFALPLCITSLLELPFIFFSTGKWSKIFRLIISFIMTSFLPVMIPISYLGPKIIGGISSENFGIAPLGFVHAGIGVAICVLTIREIADAKKYPAQTLMKNNNAPLFVSVLGDSISTFEGVNPVGYNVFYDSAMQQQNGLSSFGDTWWAKVNQHLNAYLCVNNSFSGSMVSGSQFPSASSAERTSFLHTEEYTPDIILLYIGFNDFGNGILIGDERSLKNSADSFYYSYIRMLRQIKNNYPQATIVCSTLMRGYIGHRPEWAFPEKLRGIPFEDYNKAIRKAAEKEKVLLCDNAAKNYYYETLDGTHPTINGHLVIAQAWIENLSQFFKGE